MLRRTMSRSRGLSWRWLRVENVTAYFAQGRSKCGRLRLPYRTFVEVSAKAPKPAREARALPGLRGSARRGGTPRTPFTIAPMCSGVVPQQPPTRLSQPFAAQATTFGANDSGVSGNPVGESASGNPAFGYAPT